VVKRNFRERPVIVDWRTYELIGLKRVVISKHPLKAEALAKQKNDVLFFFQSLSRGLVTSEYFFLNFDLFILNVNKKQIGYTACSITF
jgi:hypothetical protein